MIRILRILEYTFESNEEAEEHFGGLGVPANGTFRTRRKNGNIVIRSAMITDFDALAAEANPEGAELKVRHDFATDPNLEKIYRENEDGSN